MKGIDISSYQKNLINFSKVKESGIDFVIIRDGYGRFSSQKDSAFDEHYKEAKRVGLKVGAYHYSYCSSKGNAKLEAMNCLKFLEGKDLDLPVFYDVEDEIYLGKLSKEEITEIILIFCNTIKAHGYQVGVYANKNWFTNKIDMDKLRKFGFKIWIAQYDVKEPGIKPYDIWQYTSKGEVSGIKGNVDMNICSCSAPSNKKSLEEIAMEVIHGHFGNGEARKKMLEKEGYDYKEVQKRVNEILKQNEDKSVYYIVKKGDNLTKIAKKFGTTVQKLKKINNIKNANLIYENQRIKVKE